MSGYDIQMSKTITVTRNINSFTDTEQTATDASEIIVPKKQFYEKLKHTRFVVENCKKDIIQYKTERDTLKLQLNELEKVADKQLSLRKELEKQNKLLNDELMMMKGKHVTKCEIDMAQTDDINVINKQIEDEVRRNLERNKAKILDPYLNSLKTKYEV